MIVTYECPVCGEDHEAVVTGITEESGGWTWMGGPGAFEPFPCGAIPTPEQVKAMDERIADHIANSGYDDD